MEQRSGEQGFTIVELMVVVAIIAVLAAIVVPTFTKESKKSKAQSEVGAMFGELAVREDQYKLENGVYLEATGCPSGTPSGTARAVSCATWDTLRIRPPTQSLYCTYEVVTNASASTDPPSWVDSTMWTPPTTSWFFMVATCDMDGNGVTSQYFRGSVNSKLEKHNDGN